MSENPITLSILLLGKACGECDEIEHDLSGSVLLAYVRFDDATRTSTVVTNGEGQVVHAVLPIKRMEHLEDYFRFNRALPHGLSVGNTPITLMEKLPPELEADRTSILIMADDWESVSLLPSLLSSLAVDHKQIEIHMICKAHFILFVVAPTQAKMRITKSSIRQYANFCAAFMRADMK